MEKSHLRLIVILIAGTECAPNAWVTGKPCSVNPMKNLTYNDSGNEESPWGTSARVRISSLGLTDLFFNGPQRDSNSAGLRQDAVR